MPSLRVIASQALLASPGEIDGMSSGNRCSNLDEWRRDGWVSLRNGPTQGPKDTVLSLTGFNTFSQTIISTLVDVEDVGPSQKKSAGSGAVQYIMHASEMKVQSPAARRSKRSGLRAWRVSE